MKGIFAMDSLFCFYSGKDRDKAPWAWLQGYDNPVTRYVIMKLQDSDTISEIEIIDQKNQIFLLNIKCDEENICLIGYIHHESHVLCGKTDTMNGEIFNQDLLDVITIIAE
ncbi:hypothetical protein BMT55_02085 [Listeria newyorkensis]|uniref:Uncharacterized protein n=1 Tax=Listeria newyorkensis TaxID=1497681 RepID=A0ABX4XPV8_9LIST|nr:MULTISPECIES: hypothetical protein [Listeria]KGL42226.1 hypothetical protein EP56_10860 [Listeriaceae bacterium FSL A5-0209]KGL38181.1 hypothetical protein EP58_15600 [Listeria newyorkensis]PNP94300.1 hypothetical protein BMT55_02085 [Listeria newyorkensis]RQW67742.1 hypothetical protein DUK53_05345 [Listeria sp. SHR_NRA_18]WAO22715.1 hypothetical protein OTR81_05425 [Listeria newyorkensis]